MSQEHVLLILNDKFVTLPDAEIIVSSRKQELVARHSDSKIDQFLLSNIVLGRVELSKELYNFIYFIDENGEFNQNIPNSPDIKASLKFNQAISLNKSSVSKVDTKLSKLKKFKKLNNVDSPTSSTFVKIDASLSSSPSPSLPELTLKKPFDIDAESKLKFFNDLSSSSSDDEDIDDLIDENELIDTPLNTSSIICLREPNNSGVKKRKACKDCTCGLAEKEAFGFKEEDKNPIEPVKKIQFTDKDLTEIDFTIEGKTGGCGSCSLGDAFRCSGCPFLGLPAFKPGQAINLNSIDDDV